MNRKNFFGSAIAILASTAVSGRSGLDSLSSLTEEESICKKPPYLISGDTIGITSPGGYITVDDVQPAIKKIESWGYKIKVGDTIGKRDFTFGGTDEERRKDFQDMIDDENVKAILCARGGYGAVRIIDSLNFESFKTHPKWIIGFSDATVFHAHLNKNYRTASIHSKMCNSFPVDWSAADDAQKLSIESINSCLKGESLKYEVTPNSSNKLGTAKGELLGGNLSIIENLSGTASDISTEGKILFLEDTEEYLYNIDRMFWNLKRSGKLDHLKGLIIGGFKIKTDESTEQFSLTLEQIVMEKVNDFDYPVCFDFPVGHQKNNMALRCGIIHQLDVKSELVKLISL